MLTIAPVHEQGRVRQAQPGGDRRAGQAFRGRCCSGRSSTAGSTRARRPAAATGTTSSSTRVTASSRASPAWLDPDAGGAPAEARGETVTRAVAAVRRERARSRGSGPLARQRGSGAKWTSSFSLPCSVSARVPCGRARCRPRAHLSRLGHHQPRHRRGGDGRRLLLLGAEDGRVRARVRRRPPPSSSRCSSRS